MRSPRFHAGSSPGRLTPRGENLHRVGPAGITLVPTERSAGLTCGVAAPTSGATGHRWRTRLMTSTVVNGLGAERARTAIMPRKYLNRGRCQMPP